MPFYRVDADDEIGGDLVIGLAGSQKFEDFYFTAGQAIWPMAATLRARSWRLRMLAEGALGGNCDLRQDAWRGTATYDVLGGAKTGLGLAGQPGMRLDPGQGKKRKDGLKASLALPGDIQSSAYCLFGFANFAAALVQIGLGKECRRALPVLPKTVP